MTQPDFRSFVTSERQRLIRFVRSRLADAADMDAEDLVQDVLTRMLEKADASAPLDNLAAYAYRALRNRIIDALRTRRANESLDQPAGDGGLRLADVLSDDGPGPEALLGTVRGRERLFAALDRLSERERAVIIAHEFEGIPFKTLADQWQTPLNTLLSHKSRGLRKLADDLASS